MSEIEDGPPSARVIPYGAFLFALGITISYFLGVPTATELTAPFFAVGALMLLPHGKRHIFAAGYVMLAFGCLLRSLTILWVDHLTEGQTMAGVVTWGYLAFLFMLTARMTLARGVR
jgi:hypothetical protein